MRPFPLFAAGGTVASAAAVVAGGQVGPVPGSLRLTTWLGLQAADTVHPGRSWWPGTVMSLGMAVLVVLWFVLLRADGVRFGLDSQRRIWQLAAWWAAPLALGPPVLSSDVYTYAAQGIMAGRGFDPYAGGPSELGPIAATNAVDPTWRSVPSPYGPLATLVEHLAVVVGGGGPLGAVVVLRIVAVLSVAGMGLLGVQLVEPARRPLVLALILLNPLLLLQVVSAAHFEGLMGALLLATLVAVRRGHRRLALVLGFAATAVKAPAFVIVLAVAAVSVVGLRWRDALRDLLISATVVGACAAVMSLIFPPDAWGWVKALETPTQGHTPIAPASLLGDLLGRIVPFASGADVSAAGRIGTLGIAGCIVLVLTLTANQRPLATTAGLGLLAVAVLGPVLYPWYLLWGLCCLAPVVRGRQVTWFLAASGAGALTKLWGLTPVQNAVVTSVVLLAAAVVVLRTFPRPLGRRWPPSKRRRPGRATQRPAVSRPRVS